MKTGLVVQSSRTHQIKFYLNPYETYSYFKLNILNLERKETRSHKKIMATKEHCAVAVVVPERVWEAEKCCT